MSSDPDLAALPLSYGTIDFMGVPVGFEPTRTISRTHLLLMPLLLMNLRGNSLILILTSNLTLKLEHPFLDAPNSLCKRLEDVIQQLLADLVPSDLNLNLVRLCTSLPHSA